MADVVPTRLTCEYLEAPLAVESMEPRLSWVLESDQRSVIQSAYHIQAATSLELLEQDSADLWDSGKVTSRDSVQIQYKGKPLSSGEDVYWRVRVWTDSDQPSEWSEPGYWRMGLLKTTDWQARWVSHPREVNDAHDSDPLPAPVFRKEFELSKPVERALVYVSALGVYELRLNGEKTGDHILAPEWTNYHKHLQYQVYDVSDQVSKGTNAIGAMVGDGWYAGRLGISHIVNKQHLRAHYGKKLQLIVQLDVTYEDGSTERIVTDPTWRTTDNGPIRKACLLDGETYDATKALTGWDTTGFDDSEWTPCLVGDSVPAKLIAQPNEPIRVTEERSPIAIGEPAPGIYVVDFGQNLAGWCRIKLNEKQGTRVRLRHAEMLQEDGNIYRTNLRMGSIHDEFGAEQEDVYICSGEGEEYYEPHFTYHGFRYVEVVGLESKLDREDIVARAFHSAPPMTGSFESSSELLNKLMSNIVWTHRSNMHSVPTDCPQRDERMGWMGDMLVFAQPACFNMDMAAFFTKWMRDIADDQADDGRFPDFAPHPYEPEKRFSGVPAWGDAGVVIPYRMYVNYADQRICREYFDEMRRWVDWIHRENPSLLWENNRNNDYGDWLNGDTLKLEGYPTGGAEVPKDVFSTAMFYMSTDMLAKMADVIGRDAEAREYSELANSIREAFIQAYVEHDGKIKGHTQSAYALALHLDLVPDNLREASATHMIQRIRDYKNHISTGFHTTIMLMNELTRAGRSDVAYMLINNRTFPSWGYTIDQGGTTIWERWDGYVEGRGFQDPGMNSFNHYAIGAVGEWMYRTILGINPDPADPGYQHILLKPVPGGGLTWAKGSYDSIQGTIATGWTLDNDTLTLTVRIPANTTATLELPTDNADAVTESGQSVNDSVGVTFVKATPTAAVYKLGSGQYTFKAPCKMP